MKVVIDTNVLISSFFGGKPRKIIDLWFEGKIVLCLSTPILEEYVKVLSRFEFNNELLLARFLNAFEQNDSLLFVNNPEESNWVQEDIADNKFIACARALRADFILSGDIHLKQLKEISSIKILSPAEFLKYFKNFRK
ncbi:MAG: putative toxin-antitoxin system toxin component, PIN family [Candidatus Fischerbacteria bacterium RBG_13_37_8]|uniref:Putative toxin-antitoxin system toxin component, PIN family n=1 Tax=Candidatus Fischerbacteria bacterium RBG_13_37_8 TaxID=1817863 RepID=A0A1F5VVC5_9BACT|nr:MAG: putative toxin-antitoxin system toxin component, PIN family [Candidatus Fischerbacteria bacterium RBG_13_37_8]